MRAGLTEEGEGEEGERGEKEEGGGCWGLEVRATDRGRGEFRMVCWTCSGVGGYWERGSTGYSSTQTTQTTQTTQKHK